MSRGSLFRGVSVQGGSLSGSVSAQEAGFSVQGVSGGISVQGVSVQGVSVQGVSARAGLCPGVRGSLSRGSLSGRPPVGTDRCKNINLSQSSFAGGKYMD